MARRQPARRQPARRPLWPPIRTTLTWINGTTPAAVLLAVASRARLRRGPHGVLIAEGYRWPAPRSTCFTVGGVVFCRDTADWLLDVRREHLLRHETRHVGQYAALGPFFLPAYAVASMYSWLVTGAFGCRNAFERHAGLAGGGYREVPMRPWAARVRGTVRRRTAR